MLQYVTIRVMSEHAFHTTPPRASTREQPRCRRGRPAHHPSGTAPRHAARTARSRTSRENLVVVLLFMAPASQRLESTANTGRFSSPHGALPRIDGAEAIDSFILAPWRGAMGKNSIKTQILQLLVSPLMLDSAPNASQKAPNARPHGSPKAPRQRPGIAPRSPRRPPERSLPAPEFSEPTRLRSHRINGGLTVRTGRDRSPTARTSGT